MVSPLLRITPFPLGGEQALKHLPEDLRHLLPQIRARFARKVRNTKLSADQLLKSNKKGRSHPTGTRCSACRRGAHRAPAPLGWHPFRLPCPSSWAADGKRDLLLRAQRALKERG